MAGDLLGEGRLGGTTTSATAAWSSDGTGALTSGTGWIANGGTVTGPNDPGDASVEVAPDRSATFTLSGGAMLHGRVGVGRDIAIATNVTDGQDPAWMALVRRNPAPTLADLQGEWWQVEWWYDPSLSVPAGSSLTDVWITPEGYVVPDVVALNRGGVVGVPPGVVLFDEAISIAGGWLVDGSSFAPAAYRGGLALSGDVVLLGAAEDSTGQAAVKVLLRRSSAVDPTPAYSGTSRSPASPRSSRTSGRSGARAPTTPRVRSGTSP